MPQTEHSAVITSVSSSHGQAVGEEPILATHDIQGNILGGFHKDHEMLVFLKITQVAAAKQ